MKKFKTNKNRTEFKKEQVNNNVIAFRLSERFLLPLLHEVADVAQMSMASSAQAIVRDFLVEYNKKTLKLSEEAKALNLPEPPPIEPFINSTDFRLQCGALLRESKACELKSDLEPPHNAEQMEVVSND
ncbi:hypothetical protein [Moritella sp.]|uniref:hypothetical protein n=1 Tax=Moritella sp. TaxID=78556 RepID=UPI001DF72464|nr:hypothetical protein [Moritella sp.]MCJ8349178.1 hypothetical protein [Moritella sp.]NQZ39466.1 hypothetical protein [Moritella sp.]